MLYSFAYISRSKIKNDDDILKRELESILSVSRRLNEKADLTGVLLFGQGCFTQVLEGPLDALELVIEKIMRDQRHGGITVLHYKPVVHRSFAGFSMGYAGMSSLSAMKWNVEGMLDGTHAVVATETGAQLLSRLQFLLTRGEVANL